MKQKKILLNIPSRESNADMPDLGKPHERIAWDTPIRTDAWDMDEGEKIEKIEKHFRAIMHILGLDLTDDSLRDTPYRVAKMYVKEAFRGLNPKNKPSLQFFENKYAYGQMLLEKNIPFYSHCEHHFVPIYGKVHVAYLPHNKIIGLSKLHRIVHYYAQRPQVQERLTVQIGKEVEGATDTEDIAVAVDARHMCVASRGVHNAGSETRTTYLSGIFSGEKKSEFLHAIAGILKE